MIDCKNCGIAFDGKFCPNCSQKADTHRLTLAHFAHDATHAVTHTDKGILLLIKAMFTKPGLVGREYVEGKRKKYFSPITFLLIMMAIQVFVVKKTDLYAKFTREVQKTFEEFVQKSPNAMNDFNKRMNKADKQASVMTDNNKLVTVIFIPLLSVLTWLFFKKSKFNYAENLVFNVLINAQMIVWFLLICVIPLLIKPGLIIVAMYLYIFGSWIYSIIAYKQFYQQSTGKTIWKGITIQVVYYAIVSYASDLVMQYIA